MSAIDLVVLGMLKKEALSAYAIQKSVEERGLSRWVKISTPSVYKKVLQLEKKGLVKSANVRQGKSPEKAVYFLTSSGDAEFKRLMLKIASSPINFFLDLNAVVINLDSISPDLRTQCLDSIEKNVAALKTDLEEAIRDQGISSGLSDTALTVLQQQHMLAQAIDTWLATVK